MATVSRQGRSITVETYQAGQDLSLAAQGTLVKKGPIGVVAVSAATDRPVGSLHERVLGSGAGNTDGVAVAVEVINRSREIICIAHEALSVGDRVGPSATGRVQKTIAAGSLYLGTVEEGGAAAGDVVIVDVSDASTFHG